MNSIADRAAYYARIALLASEQSGGIRWAFIGDGIQTSFNIDGASSTNSLHYSVNIDGITQDPNNYTIISGFPYTLVMSSPVPNGSNIVIVSLNSGGGGSGGATGATGLTGATGPAGGGSGGGATGATGPASPAGGTRWAYTGNGSQVAFSVTGAISTLSTAFLVVIDGIVQDPNNYSISGTTLTMSDPVPSGSQIVIVSLNGIQGATGGGGGGVGATGATGPAGGGGGGSGATGATGLTGATGPAGPSGTAGSGGIRWSYTGNGTETIFNISGATTLNAAAYLVNIDGITQDPNDYTIQSGSPYTLTISTAVPNGSVIVIVSIVGPVGATGTGATGSTGLIGATGATGLQGSTGPSGGSGATGATGLQGSTGPSGGSGATGATGLQGATGPAGGGGGGSGATGATGLTGATGPAGGGGPTNFGNVWSYIGNGSQTLFAITGGLSILAPAYLVTIDGVFQKTTNYTIDNVTPRTLTFSQAVPNGSEINIVSLSVA